MNNGDMPAMAVQFDFEESPELRKIELWRGLTKREHFAAMAFASMVGGMKYKDTHFDKIATDAVYGADALLKALETKEEG